ncbi:MAG: translation initiation factor IF-1 [Verrucomicrobiota bacterium]
MPGEPPITTTGTITETLPNGTYHASLPNGKIVVAHPDRRTNAPPLPSLNPGDKVHLELTPYDFSKARITHKTN